MSRRIMATAMGATMANPTLDWATERLTRRTGFPSIRLYAYVRWPEPTFRRVVTLLAELQPCYPAVTLGATQAILERRTLVTIRNDSDESGRESSEGTARPRAPAPGQLGRRRRGAPPPPAGARRFERQA